MKAARTRSSRAAHGLTLLELLAAVVILSAVAAGFASVARDASATLRESATSEQNAETGRALSIWEASREGIASELAELAQRADESGAPAQRSWGFTIDGREHWRVEASAAPSANARINNEEPVAAWTQRAAWVTLRVWRDGEDPSGAITTARLVPLLPSVQIPPSQRGREGGAS